MKKTVGFPFLLLIAIALVLTTSTNAAALAPEAGVGRLQAAAAPGPGPPLTIDPRHVYAGMKKSYAEGYQPGVAGGKATPVLPLVPNGVTGPVRASVNLGDPAHSPFVYKNYEREFELESFTFGDESVDRYLIQFALDLAKGRVNGSYPVVFDLGGITAGGEVFSAQFTIYVPITDGVDPRGPEPEPEAEVSPTGPPLRIDTGHIYTGMAQSYAEGYRPAVSGDKAALVLPLLSERVSDPVAVSLNLGDPAQSPFIFKNYEKMFSQTDLAKQGSRGYLISFSPDLAPHRINGSYPVVLTVNGVTDRGEAFSQPFSLLVSITDGAAPPSPGMEAEIASRPKLIVTGYSLAGDCLEAGETTTLTMTLHNTGRQKVGNIKLLFAEESGEILPEGTGATFVPQIAAGASYTWNLAVTATATAASRPHPAMLTMEYEDHRGQPVTAADRIVLAVRQPVRLEYEEPSFPARVTRGDTPAFSMTLMNLGKSVIYNTLLKFEIPGLAGGGSVLVGTILPGESKTGTANFRVDAETSGEVSGTLTLSYEDDYGERHAEELTLSTTIQEKLETPPPDKKREAPASARSLRWLALAGGAALTAFLCTLGRRWLKEKKAREEDEMRL